MNCSLRACKMRLIFRCSLILILFSVELFAQNDKSKITITDVTPRNPSVGDNITFHGLLENRNQATAIVVDDPITNLCTRVTLNENGEFNYSTSQSLKAGIYSFVFSALTYIPVKEIYVVSVSSSGFSGDSYIAVNNNLDISTGDQGDELDEETNAVAMRTTSGTLEPIDYSGPTASSVLTDIANTASEIGGSILSKMQKSPTTVITLGATGLFCLASAGTACAIMIPVVVATVAKTSISASADVALKHVDNLDQATKANVEKAISLSLNLSSVYCVVDASFPDGSFSQESVASILSLISRLTEDNIKEVKLNDYESAADNSIESLSLQIITKDNKCYTYLIKSIESLENIDNGYLDFRIYLKNGHNILGRVVSGEMGGIIYGSSTGNAPSYFKITNPEGKIVEIPNVEIHAVEVESLLVSEFDISVPYLATLNLGKENMIKEGATYGICRNIRNVLGVHEIEYIGNLRIVQVNETSSTALIINIYPGKRINIGDYCY
jgi:hypothetical protein